MNLVVDTNIVFSGILNPNGVIADILLNCEKIQFYAPTFILKELENHHEKMKKISRLSDDDLAFLKRIIFKEINLIDEQYIKQENWAIAKDLVSDVYEFDIPFVALCVELEVPLWTGDKKLAKGLAEKGVDWVMDTQEIKEKL